MDEEVFELAKENGLEYSEAEEVQEIMEENGLEAEEAYELWKMGV